MSSYPAKYGFLVLILLGVILVLGVYSAGVYFVPDMSVGNIDLSTDSNQSVIVSDEDLLQSEQEEASVAILALPYGIEYLKDTDAHICFVKYMVHEPGFSSERRLFQVECTNRFCSFATELRRAM